MAEWLRLLAGTVALRPYVFLFLFIYAMASTAHLGWRRTALFLPLGYGLAWLSEYASIHWGFPYGDYYYITATMGRELWVAGVPFMDSLSYVFLSYCSYATALFLLSPTAVCGWRLWVLETHCLRRSWRTRVLGASLFVLLDLIIDPVALQGHRWFLGQIYGYRVAGIYFGVPLSNFAGWFIVGLALITLLQGIDRLWSGIPRKAPLLSTLPGMPLLGPALYLGVLGFNLAVTFWIGERFLGLVGCLILTYCILLAFFLSLYKLDHLRPDAVRSHLKDFPHSPAALLLDRERNRDGFPPSCA